MTCSFQTVELEMDSNSNNERSESGESAKALTCLSSINSSGVVFIARHRMKISSELTLAVQSCVLGLNFEWNVHGWVVECRQVKREDGRHFQVTLLFSDVPEGLRQIIALAEGRATHAYPEVKGATLFGLN